MSLGVHPEIVRNWRSAGKIEVAHHLGDCRFAASEIETILGK
jgi:predicted site-specific integrase-resolvase